MSEHEHDQEEEQAAEAEEEDGDAEAGDGEAEEPDAEPDEEAEPDEGPAEAEAASEPEPGALTEKEIEARLRKLDTLRAATARRVGEILGDDAVAYMPCPLCADGVPAHVPEGMGGQVPPEVFAATQKYLGMPDPETFANHPNFERCPDCKGRGEVITGSTVPNYMLTGCPNCGTKGYIVKGQLPVPGAAPNGETQPAPVLTGPTSPDNLPPEAQRLKELGYMIVPPMQPIGVVG